MRKYIKLLYKNLTSILKWVNPFFDFKKFILAFYRYIKFFKDWIKYSKMTNSESMTLKNIYPCIHDNTSSTGFDSHYFYQDIWAFKNILQNKAQNHVDIGSRLIYVGMLSTITKVTFIDIRPLEATLCNLESKYGTILNLPYKNNSIESLSCLHVAEHIGLGRYGDPLDPHGTIKAINELKRVLAIGGNLYFSLPIGIPRLQFNAHRIHSPKQILEYFSDLKLIRFCAIDDKAVFYENIEPLKLSNQNYACGMFWFRKE